MSQPAAEGLVNTHSLSQEWTFAVLIFIFLNKDSKLCGQMQKFLKYFSTSLMYLMFQFFFSIMFSVLRVYSVYWDVRFNDFILEIFELNFAIIRAGSMSRGSQSSADM